MAKKDDQYRYKAKKPPLPSRIASAVKGLIESIHESGSTEHTVMLLPQDRSKSITLHISNYVITFIILLLVGFSSLFLYTLNSRDPESIDFEAIKETDKEAYKQLAEYSQTLDKLEREAENYYKSINDIFKITGAELPEDSTASIEQTDKLMFLPDDEKVSSEDEPLKTILSDIEMSKSHITNIIELLELKQKLIHSIPSRWPVWGYRRVGQCTSKFGYRIDPFTGKKAFHSGVDIAHRNGTPIVATADGVVISSRYWGAYGNVVIIKHKYGFRTVYGHNSRNLVRTGNKVERGDRIAYMGSTGRSTGPHVHYEVRIGGKRIDPWPYLTTKF